MDRLAALAGIGMLAGVWFGLQLLFGPPTVALKFRALGAG